MRHPAFGLASLAAAALIVAIPAFRQPQGVPPSAAEPAMIAAAPTQPAPSGVVARSSVSELTVATPGAQPALRPPLASAEVTSAEGDSGNPTQTAAASMPTRRMERSGLFGADLDGGDRDGLRREILLLEGRVRARDDDLARLKDEVSRLRAESSQITRTLTLLAEHAPPEIASLVASALPANPGGQASSNPGVTPASISRSTSESGRPCSREVRRGCVATINDAAARNEISLDDFAAWSSVPMPEIIRANPGAFGRPLRAGERVRLP